MKLMGREWEINWQTKPTQFYDLGLRRSSGSLEKMKTTIRISLGHRVSRPENPHLSKRPPPDKDSCHKQRQAEANGVLSIFTTTQLRTIRCDYLTGEEA